MAGPRIGILGGTFDPPHVGHLIVASDAHAALGLDQVLFVPAARPPHKPGRVRADPETRLRMVRAAIEGDHRFAADGLELGRTGPSYTVDTLRQLRAGRPDATWMFLIGTDAAREMHSWKAPAEVARLVTVAVLSRGGEVVDAAAFALPVVPVSVTRVDVSSSQLRERVAAGASIRYLVPDAVRHIVETEQLYLNPEP